MRKLHITLLLALALGTALPLSAQEFRTSYFMETSNFRHQLNPALLDTTAYIGMPFFGNINVGTTSNVGLGDFVYKLSGNPDYTQTTFMSPTVSADKFLGNIHDKNRLDAYVNYNIFSVGFRGLKGMNVVELNLRSNTNVSLPYELFHFMKTTGDQEHYTIKDVGARTQNYLELALGHSHKLGERWTVGGKVKLLFGLAYADLRADRLDLTMNGDEWRIEGDAQLKAAVLSSTFSHEDADKNDPQTGRRRVDGLDDVSFGMPGFGLAFDLGGVFRATDDLTISAGLTDLGFIHWGKTQNASSAGSYSFSGFDDIYVNSGDYQTGSRGRTNKLGDQFEDIGDDLEEMFAVYDDGEKGTTQALAATLNVGVEYRLPSYRPLAFNFLYSSRIHGLYSYHQGTVGLDIRPVKWFEFSCNTGVTSTGWLFGAAASLKAKHFDFFVGSDRFFGKVSKQFIPINRANMNLVFGMSFPLQ